PDAQGYLIEHPVEVFKDVLSSTSMTANTAALEKSQIIMTARNYQFAAALTKELSLVDFLSDFCTTFDCDFHLSPASEIILTLVSPWNMTPEKTFQEPEIIDIEIDGLADFAVNNVRYLYNYNTAIDQYLRQPYFDKPTAWPSSKSEPLHLLYTADFDTAYDVVQRYILQRLDPPKTGRITVNLGKYIGLDVASVISVTHDIHFPSETRTYQIQRADIDVINDTADLECRDINSLGGGIIILGDVSFSQNYA
ncbi:MAG: hypothetical protein GY771_00475, partial [bacterium]|nr:hypothetical protein [bacterium]